MKPHSLFNPKYTQDNYHIEATAYYYRTWHGYEMPALHSHNHIEIMYVLSSKCQVVFDHSQHILHKGHFMVIDSNVPHRLIVEKDTDCRMLNIEFGFTPSKEKNPNITFGKMVHESPSLSNFYESPFEFRIFRDTLGLFHLLRQLIRLNDECLVMKTTDQCESPFYLQCLYYQLLVNIGRLNQEQFPQGIAVSSEYVNAAIQLIHDLYDQPIKVSDLANALNIHENYLQKLFKNQQGMTIVQYIRNLRLDKAKMLLENTQCSILEITDLIGLDSRQYFTKSFKDRFGLPPKAYRKKYAKGSW